MSETLNQNPVNSQPLPTKPSEAEVLKRALEIAASKKSKPMETLQVHLPDADPGAYVKCPQCHSEWRGLEASGICWDCEQLKAQKAAKYERRRARLLEITGGEYPLKEFTFDKFKSVTGNQQAAAFANNFNFKIHNTYFSGPPGSGKTHLAYAIGISAFMGMGEPSLEILTTEQLSRRVTGNNFDKKSETIRRLIEVDILILDDLCRKKETENTIDAICEIMDGRKYAYRNGLIITANYSVSDLAERLDDSRLPSRITGMCGANGFRVEPRNQAGEAIDWRLAR